MINGFTINPPLVKLAGDVVTINGRTLEQWRNGQIVRSIQLVQPQPLETIQAVGSETITTVYVEVGMPGQNVSMTNVRENQTTGVIIVDFSSGTQIEFASWADVGLVADAVDSTTDLAEKVLLGKAFRSSPDGTNKTTQIGASVSTNLLASTPIVYTEPQ